MDLRHGEADIRTSHEHSVTAEPQVRWMGGLIGCFFIPIEVQYVEYRPRCCIKRFYTSTCILFLTPVLHILALSRCRCHGTLKENEKNGGVFFTS